MQMYEYTLNAPRKPLSLTVYEYTFDIGDATLTISIASHWRVRSSKITVNCRQKRIARSQSVSRRSSLALSIWLQQSNLNMCSPISILAKCFIIFGVSIYVITVHPRFQLILIKFIRKCRTDSQIIFFWFIFSKFLPAAKWKWRPKQPTTTFHSNFFQTAMWK